jgi:uncharacterized membrane protein YkoI
MIDEEQALAIAKQAIAGHVELQDNAHVDITVEDDTYVVTFIHDLPPGTLGADYDAQVRIDAYTGDVIEILLGS